MNIAGNTRPRRMQGAGWVAFDRGVRMAASHGRPAAVGRWTEARDAIYDQITLAFEKMLTYANHDVGLFSEEIALTGGADRQLPAGFHHLALIDAAITLHAALNTASWR